MSMEQLAQLAAEQVAAEKFVEACEQQLKDAEKALRELSWNRIPEVMEELGLEEFTTSEGTKVVVKETIRASISKSNLPLATAWLRENGHGRIIKNEVKVNLTSDDEVEEVQKALGDKFQIARKESVNAQTLSAFVRQMFAEGEELPQQLLGVFRQRESKVVKS